MKFFGRVACAIFLLSIFLSGEKVLTIDEPFKKPTLVKVERNKVFIIDRPNSVVHVYALDNVKEHKTICSRGDGPGECRSLNCMSLQNEKVVISGEEKLLYFNLKGRLLDERKVPYAHTRVIPLGEKYVCREYETRRGKTMISAIILDSDFSSPQKLDQLIIQRPYRGKNGKRNLHLLDHYFNHDIIGQKIIVGNTQKGFHFGIFDKNGAKLYDINREYKKRPITEDEKKTHLEQIKIEFGPTVFRQLSRETNVIFPDYYPAYELFEVHRGKIYVRLYPMIEGKQKLLVLDAKGNQLAQYTVPTLGASYSFCIENSHYYYLSGNPDQETWELHAVKLS